MTETNQLESTLKCMQWNDLPHIDDTDRINRSDEDCLRDVLDVLLRHGKTEKFGISLLHRHFDIADDEILVEGCDEVARTLTTTVVKRTDLDADTAVQTMWRFDDPDGSVNGKICKNHGLVCVRRCVNVGSPFGGHTGVHTKM